ncbi:MAG: efflux RND transporter periplasmic adaptor subunit [Planctomycetes bacterium]|nr:efflux RND transporter periplasmic adaptor subunit [Planctomycetota bacterium]
MIKSRHMIRMNLATVLAAAVLTFATQASAQAQSHGDHQHESPQSNTRSVPRDPNRLWCREHNVYEDECFICHPELKGKQVEAGPTHAEHDRDAKDGALGLWCNEHTVAEAECGICQPQLAGRLKPGDSLKVRLPSPRSAAKAGIRSARPRLAETTASIKVFCEVRYDQNRLARVTPLASGVIHSVHADVGDSVEEGDLLMEIASTEAADQKRALLVAIVQERVKKLAYQREKQLVEKEISAAQSFQQAEAEYLLAQLTTTSTRQRLMNLGFTEKEVGEVEETKSSSSIVHIHAPFKGTLVERKAVVGEAVEPGSPLFTLADLGSMWLNLSIPESKVSELHVGLPVEATFATLPGVIAKGQISWISTAVTEPSRMVEARVVVSNPERILRSNLFGEARIAVSTEKQALTVPVAAVQRFERNPFVFVKLEEDLYGLRRVEIGIRDQDRVQIIRGLELNDTVVVVGSFTLMSEFLKSRLGAGCVDD